MSNNGMKRNTIIFGDDNSSNNIKKTDELVEMMSKETSDVVNLSNIKKEAIYFGERNVSFSKPVNNNIRKIDALIEIKKKETDRLDSLESNRTIKKNTISFDDVSFADDIKKEQSVLFDAVNDNVVSDNYSKKHIRRGKINIKDDFSDDDVLEEELLLNVKEPQPVRVDSINILENEEKINSNIDSNIKSKDKNISLMLMIIMILLVVVLVFVVLILYSVTSNGWL